MSPTATRLRLYLSAIEQRKAIYYKIDFARIAQRFNVCTRTIERAVKDLREAAAFTFKTVRKGRHFIVRVVFRATSDSDRQRSNKGVFSFRKKIQNTNTASRIFGLKSRFPNLARAALSAIGLQRLRCRAAALARNDLRNCHYDNCKIIFSFPHAFNYALATLRAGYRADIIAEAYLRAMRDRHGLATDCGEYWQPSSTVSLARQLIATIANDGKTDADRANENTARHKAGREAFLAEYNALKIANGEQPINANGHPISA